MIESQVKGEGGGFRKPQLSAAAVRGRFCRWNCIRSDRLMLCAMGHKWRREESKDARPDAGDWPQSLQVIGRQDDGGESTTPSSLVSLLPCMNSCIYVSALSGCIEAGIQRAICSFSSVSFSVNTKRRKKLKRQEGGVFSVHANISNLLKM